VVVVGTMPMSTLAPFPGMFLGQDTLEELAARLRDRVERP
jgi:hypothetical protein